MSDQYVGEIRMFAGSYAPQGWAFCNGDTLPIDGNEALYSVIGATYGGDGRTHFKLPDLRGRLPIHNGTNSKSGTYYEVAQKGGTETVILTEAQLPSHNHSVAAQTASGSTANPVNAFWAASTVKQYSKAAPDATMSTLSVSSVGGSQAHDNMMPYFPVTFIIATQGLYPSYG